MVEFDNTVIAFLGVSDRELRKNGLMFRMIGSPTIVRLGRWALVLARFVHFPIGWAVKNNIFARFCGGQNIAECNITTEALALRGVGTILDYSVEGKSSEAEFDRTRDEIICTIEKAKGNPNIPFCVFKVTGVAGFDVLAKMSSGATLIDTEKTEWKLAFERVRLICATASETRTPVLIDAEESWIQGAIDTLCEQMIETFNISEAIVYTTIQLYRIDRLAYLKQLHKRATGKGLVLGIKPVRGAYMEKERKRASEMGYPSPIHLNKQATDTDFNAALTYSLEHHETIAICAGTHNENSARLATEMISIMGIPLNHPHICFAQLLGMSDHISFNLASSGYRVAKYVPYGPISEVIPYLIRRAEENTSVEGQTGRELALIESEIKRRSAILKA